MASSSTSTTHGYDSTVTLADGLAAIHLVWIAIGLLLAGLGTNAFLLDVGEPSTLLRGVRAGAGLVMVMTVVVWVYWAIRNWSNLERVGRKARLTLSAIIPRYLGMLGVAVVAGLVALGVEGFRRPATALAAMAFIGSTAGFPVVARHLLRTFWSAGAPVGEAAGAPPVLVKIWLIAAWKLVWLLVLTGMSGLDSHQIGAASVVAGVVAIGLGASGFRLMPLISTRFDERLVGMIENVGVDNSYRQPEVTSQQIQSAWADSEALVNFQGH